MGTQRASGRGRNDSAIKAVLGPTNTGKTHLAIERMCAHSSGAIGFPLRLLAREVYDKVCAIKGLERVALITGEERIEPKNARWLLCTAEAMPVAQDLAFVALDEAQLGADRERGHVFTDRLLHARGREETMILGSATLEPMVRALVPDAEIVSRPRFSTLSHAGARKLSRIPPRSAIVAFSAEQVYAVAEMLRRFRGGAAVVMGALSPETRNRQVALYQSGEVDYLVATDAIGMGLNLDLDHVAFAGLSKFDGQRQRRLTTAEMAQIAGRAGRHQRDGTFGTLAGSGGHDAEFTAEEVYAIEEHRFAPLTRLFWRNPEPRFGSIATLIGDLERAPEHPALAPAPAAIDLAVLRILAEDPAIADSARDPALVERLWEVCRLPDFRQHGPDTHARFVARLWQDLQCGFIGDDYVARAIAELDRPEGDIDTLQMRIAAIRSWSYVAQRRDWLRAKDEMAARARSAEARLSDALHARLTERFVNRRTSVLMKRLGPDAGLLPVTLEDDVIAVDGEAIGRLTGFRFVVDPAARLADHKLMLAAAERHLPDLRASRAAELADAIKVGAARIKITRSELHWDGETIARLLPGNGQLAVTVALDPALDRIPAPIRTQLIGALEDWAAQALVQLEPLHRLDAASLDPAAGPELRALLIRLVEAGGTMLKATSGVERLTHLQRQHLRRLGVRIGALDLFVPEMLRPGPLDALRTLAAVRGKTAPAPHPVMPPVLPALGRGPVPPGYRQLGQQALRIDMAEKLLSAAHGLRTVGPARGIVLDPAVAVSMGLSTSSYTQLLRLGGFQPGTARSLRKGEFGPPKPLRWRWQPPRRGPQKAELPPVIASDSPFAALAGMLAR